VLGCALAIRGAEPLSVAGRIVLNAASSAPYALESARDGRLIAALTDPRGLVIVNEWVILQAESTDTTLRGLPVLEVIDVLPEHWKQPSNWDHYAKGFGAWSGFGKTIRAENYTGAPLEDRRAYHDDNGILGLPLFGVGSGTGHPPVILRALLTAEGLQLTWNVQSGARYELIGSRTLESGYSVVETVVASATGSTSITVRAAGPQQFFKVQY
jgi:hypothetical protein